MSRCVAPKVASKWINPNQGCATSAQQEPLYWLQFGLRSASASFISSFLTIINPLFTNTYKTLFRTVDPKVEGSSPFGLAVKWLASKYLSLLAFFIIPFNVPSAGLM
jgi:hypothetical protein